MNFFNLFGMCFICFCLRFVVKANHDYDNYDFNKDDNLNYSLENIHQKLNQTTSAAIVKKNTILLKNCPENCNCDHMFKIYCSNKDFKKLPDFIPDETIHLNLSHNKIEYLDEQVFINTKNIKEIDLSYNKIKILNNETFIHLKHLIYVNLSNNFIEKLHPNIFTAATHLKVINLNQNPFEIPKNKILFNHTTIQELYLKNCNINYIYEETFELMKGLNVLNLQENPLKNKINYKAFTPLKNLKKLIIPDLEEDIFMKLCDRLTSIDIINCETFDVSCFELLTGSTFIESIKLKLSEDELMDSNELNHIKLNIINKTNILKNDHNKTLEFDNNEIYQVSISPTTIKQILIGIIITASFGILVGFICRKDTCGIKTKFCRTNRTTTRDQIRPAEEDPLNKK